MYLAARIMSGLADGLHITQKITICVFVTKNMRAFALSLCLTEAKLINAVVDNFAAVVYNSYGLIVWNQIMLVAMGISIVSSLALVQFLKWDDMSACENNKAGEQEAKQHKSFLEKLKAIPYMFIVYLIVDTLTYSTVKTFYPNLSKFFQQDFGFSNVEAGSISSIPNLVGIFSVPIIGYLFAERSPILGLLAALLFIESSLLSYLAMPSASTGLLTIAPMISFGFGHAIFSTLRSLITPLVIADKSLLPMCLSLISILSQFGISASIQHAGHLIKETGSY